MERVKIREVAFDLVRRVSSSDAEAKRDRCQRQHMLSYDCPSPDDCPYTAGGAAELAEHVNTEHRGEYKRDDWPDTKAGRSTRSAREKDDNEDDQDE